MFYIVMERRNVPVMERRNVPVMERRNVFVMERKNVAIKLLRQFSVDDLQVSRFCSSKVSCFVKESSRTTILDAVILFFVFCFFFILQRRLNIFLYVCL